MNEPCDCCEGTNQLTPKSITNRPGLDSLSYRVGTHAAFLETMKARLSNMVVEIPDPNDPARSVAAYPLQALSTRIPYEASIAMLDAWATVGDVLTFYQERIANEGYLRTATERRSILELARLVGYALRPGVAASVYLALELDRGKDVMIQPYEIKAQSSPGPGELPQTFENIEPLDARSTWNRLQPRLTQPQTITSVAETKASENVRLFVKGVNANLAPNDVVLITINNQPYKNKIFHVAEAKPEPEHDRTLVTFQEKQVPPPQATFKLAVVAEVASGYLTKFEEPGSQLSATVLGKRVVEYLKLLSGLAGRNDAAARRIMLARIAKIMKVLEGPTEEADQDLFILLLAMIEEMTGKSIDVPGDQEGPDPDDDPLRRVLIRLTKRASIPPRNTFSLDRSLARLFDRRADTGLKLASAFDFRLRQSLPVALENSSGAEESDLRAYAFRVAAPPFGHNAPLKPEPPATPGPVTEYVEWPISGRVKLSVRLTNHDGKPLSFTVSAERDGDTTSKTVPVDLNQPTVTVPLGEVTTVTSKIESQRIRFSFSNLNREFSASWSASGSKMTVEVGGNFVEITPGQPKLEKVIRSDKYSFLLSSSGSVDDLSVEVKLNWPPIIALNAKYEQIKPDSWAVIERPGKDNPASRERLIRTVVDTQRISKAEYGITGEVTQLTLDDSWLYGTDCLLTVLRGTTVFAQSEELTLAEEPIKTAICDEEAQTIELDAVYSGLGSGRWLIVAGERDDILDASGNKVRGIQSAELVMLAEVLQQIRGEDEDYVLPGDRTRTFIKLAKPLEYCYRRESVTIYGNVAKATHGETRREILGSGDAAQIFQTFALKQSPLTLISAPTPAGIESTLKVFVNDMQWREASNLADLIKTDRKFITKTDDEGKTTVIFGDGQRGARLPTGFENIRAVYRNGMGRLGNVRAEQISVLQSKPLGVKGVKNPLRASGGAEKESRDTARKNVPLTVTALDRLISIRDYADFSRTFAGIGKSFATRLTDGRRELVHVTIAGADDIPIDETSDLHRNLLKALRDFGDPNQPVALQARELRLIVLSANVRILPDYEWEPVVKVIRSKLLDKFSFERRELGQDVLLSEMIAVIQSVRGVAYVDVDAFGSIPEKKTDVDDKNRRIRRLLTPQEIALEAKKFLDESDSAKRPEPRVQVNLADFEDGAMHPAQLAYFTPEVTDTLVLNQIR